LIFLLVSEDDFLFLPSVLLTILNNPSTRRLFLGNQQVVISVHAWLVLIFWFFGFLQDLFVFVRCVTPRIARCTLYSVK